MRGGAPFWPLGSDPNIVQVSDPRRWAVIDVALTMSGAPKHTECIACEQE